MPIPSFRKPWEAANWAVTFAPNETLTVGISSRDGAVDRYTGDGMKYDGYLKSFVPMIMDAIGRGQTEVEIAKTLCDLGVMNGRQYATVGGMIRYIRYRVNYRDNTTMVIKRGVRKKTWTLQETYWEIEREYAD